MTDTTKRRRRAHIVLPVDLIHEVDGRVGQRRRSRFVQEAVEEKLARHRLKVALAEMDGALAGVDTPGWETPEAARDWVRSSRREEDPEPAHAGTAA